MRTVNPFSIVKATEYSDDEILTSWVSFAKHEDGTISSILRPEELMPKYILGSKGCGKTHILRYYSFDLRVKHYNGDMNELLKQDGYIGIYSRLDGLTASRFKNNHDNETWVAIYDYYFELFQTILLLRIYDQIIAHIGLSKVEQSNIVQKIIDYLELVTDASSLQELVNFFNKQRILIDRELIDFTYKKSLDWDKVKPLFKYGDALFEIPKIICESVSALKKIKTIFILDEYEKLPYEWQKVSLNTLVYEKKGAVTFWIGARRYGYTTKETKTAEPIREGHEFQPIFLDEIMRNEGGNSFKQFALNLFKKRLEISGIQNVSPDLFETFDDDRLLEKLRSKGDLKHWSSLRNSLKPIIKDLSTIDQLISELKQNVAEDPLMQKLKLFVFYQKWAKIDKHSVTEEIILSIAREVNVIFQDLSNLDDSIKEKCKKFKTDLLAQLAVENGIKYYQYSGIEEIINISDFNPRVFLTIIKLIIDEYYFRGNSSISKDTIIPVSAQYVGINETAKWFINDIEIDGERREVLIKAINNLIEYMYVNRFCDKPTETSPCSFYFKSNLKSSACERTIEDAKNESMLIEVNNQRKDKTLGTPQRSFQLNKIIATLYNLPTARRGVLSIGTDMMNAIFNKELMMDFDKLLKRKKGQLNAPFLNKSDNINTTSTTTVQPTLFD